MEKPSGDGRRSGLDTTILVVVVIIAGVVVVLSFTNTAKLAKELGLQPLLTAGLVELLFASLLFIRARQRATQRNVPLFLSFGYFASLGFVTGVNMWGLSLENPTIGPIVGGAISAAMWLMESVLVWLWVDSHKPHEKSLRELKKEAKARRRAAKLKQEIEWMDWLAQKPDMALVRRARREEEKRKAIVAGGLPLFFDQAESAIRNTAASESTRGIGACENTPANTATTTTTRTGTSETCTTNDNVNNINTRTGITTTSTMPPVARYINENTARTTSGIGGDEGNTSNYTSHSRTKGAGSTFDAATNTGGESTNEGTRKNTTTGTTRKKNTATARDESTSEGTSTTTNTETTNTSTRESTRKKASTTTTTSRKTGGHLRLVDVDLEQVKNVALAIYEKEGKLPGRPRLRKEANCRENQARRVLAELKEQMKEEAI